MREEQKPKTKEEIFRQNNFKELERAKARINQHIHLQFIRKSYLDSTLILNSLKDHFIFYNLSEKQLENIKDRMYYTQVPAGHQIYKAGEQGTCFFIIKTGIVEIQEEGKVRKELTPSDGFGQIALLYLTERNTTATALETTTLWVIDRVSFREAVEDVIIKEYNENRKCLEGVRFFSQLTYQQKDLVASTLIVQKFYKNQNIIQQGDPGSSLYYIKEGIASVYKGDKFVRKLNRGDSFGEQSLYYNTMRQYTIKADDEVTCLVLGRDTLNRILGDKIYDVTFKNFIKWAFDKNNIMSKLSKNHVERIIEEMKISSFKAHQSIFKKGIAGFQKLVVVIEGSLKKLKNGAVVCVKGQCYGQQFLLTENKTKILDDEIVMSTYGVIAEINNTAFYQAIESLSIEEVLMKNQIKKKKPLTSVENEFVKRAQESSLKNLIFVKKIADGQFGEILLARDDWMNLYVIKIYDKQSLQQYQIQKFITEQRKILNYITHPYVIKMGRTFQSQALLFFMNQYISGCNFYDALKELGLLSSQDCQFYIANIILLLQYFQQNCIICRDIKPQNFMVTQEGFLKLINLSTAKMSGVQGTRILKTYTIIGTPHYMAPDIILGKGYDNLVDLWSLGVTAYEFITGVLPFGDSANGAYQIYEQIMQSQVQFPEFITDKKAKKLIEQLINHNPELRHSGSFSNLKSNPFFENVPWNEFYNTIKNKPPFLPHVSQNQLKEITKISSKPLLAVLTQISQKQLLNSSKMLGKYSWESFGQYIDL